MDGLATAWNGIIESIYNAIVKVTIVTGGGLAAICFFIMMLSTYEKSVAGARAWLKRILICAVGILVVSFVFNTIYQAVTGAEGIANVGQLSNPIP